MNAIEDDALWQTLEDLRREGKVRHFGVALGPAIGWQDEGLRSMTERPIDAMQIIYNMLEQEPARAFFPVADAGRSRTTCPRSPLLRVAGGKLHARNDV